ncbi:hypothetical protein NA56DRAFT_37543 [Hyaloscypha hepaticicola]|uniref:Uncharacterized protein n=1 Tax=Hyaloscypha hepaticicola TaxID=2082293 RepID=A0A2J6PDK8_9HELO|nr:hypothetical protein NA56DRAFT_37543 [Hyaloscypha hepaticicola]
MYPNIPRPLPHFAFPTPVPRPVFFKLQSILILHSQFPSAHYPTQSTPNPAPTPSLPLHHTTTPTDPPIQFISSTPKISHLKATQTITNSLSLSHTLSSNISCNPLATI